MRDPRDRAGIRERLFDLPWHAFGRRMVARGSRDPHREREREREKAQTAPGVGVMQPVCIERGEDAQQISALVARR